VAAIRERHERLCRTVAQASGGFFGIGSESGSEKKKMQDLLSVYDAS
jgi:hypothetical protein